MSGRLALDVSLERARAMHRVWRALNDGDCPKCHQARAATEITREYDEVVTGRGIGWTSKEKRLRLIQCPNCLFAVSAEEIAAIEEMFAPAMNAAVAIFEEWQAERQKEPAQ